LVYTTVGDETDRVEISPSTSAQVSIASLRKAIIEKSDKDLVLGIVVLALNVINCKCKIPSTVPNGCANTRTSSDV